jgi:hypothetical protein
MPTAGNGGLAELVKLTGCGGYGSSSILRALALLAGSVSHYSLFQAEDERGGSFWLEG